MSEKDKDPEAKQSIADKDSTNRKSLPHGMHVYAMVLDEHAVKQAGAYVRLELAKDNPLYEVRLLIKKGTVLPGWVLEGLDNPPIEYFEGKDDFKAALDRLTGEELLEEFKSGRAEMRFIE